MGIVLAIVGFFVFELAGRNKRLKWAGFAVMILAIVLFFLSVPNLEML